MQVRSVWVAFFVISLFSSISKAQTHYPKFKLVAGANGISLGKINGMAMDSRGVMWMTDQTNKCITRYDGSHFIRYKNEPSNPNSLGGTYPECIVADSSGKIWIGFYGMGLDRFDPATGKFTHYRKIAKAQGSLSSDTVSAILIDHLGNLWVGDNGGLDQFDPKTERFKNISHHSHDSSSLSWNTVRALYEDHEGIIWVGCGLVWDNNNEGGLNRFDRSKGTFTHYFSDPKNPHSLINNKVRAIFEDSRGTFWVGTSGDGLHTMDRKTGLFERHTYNPAKPEQLSRPKLMSADDHITFISEDADRKIWIGTFRNGLIHYDPDSKKIDHFGKNADISGGFMDESAWWAIRSSDGLFWVCTQEDNVYSIDVFTNEIPHLASNRGAVNSFFQQSPSIFWFGTDSGLVRKDVNRGVTEVFKNDPKNIHSISNNSVLNVAGDKQGNLWLITLGGLNRFNLSTKIFTRFFHDSSKSSSIGSNNIIAISLDGDSGLWLGSLGNGLDYMNIGTGACTHYLNIPGDSSSLSQNFVTFILEDSTKDIWVGTWNNGGINRLDRRTGKFRHYLNDITVNAAYRDAKGIIWVGGENALYWYDRSRDKFFDFNKEDAGVPIFGVRSMLGDDQDNLWISSGTGIYRVDKSRDQVIQLGKDNGITTAYLYFGSSYKAMDGQLFFGDNNGYFAFYPEKIKINTNVPRIEFSNFLVNGQIVSPGAGGPLHEPISKTKQIDLSYNQNVFSIRFEILAFIDPDNKKEFYKLENFDKGWRRTGYDQEVYYFDVPPGNYVFQVKALNTSNGIWVTKSIAINIIPPWWSRWWAYVLFALVALLLFYLLHRFQRQKVIRAERERTREHDLEQAREIEKAYNELKITQNQLIQSEKMASLGELTAGIAHEIQNPLNFINNFSDVNTELIDELEQELDRGDLQGIKQIAADIRANEQKINHHGRRADSIVKGMLQHSRSSSGVKEPVDINALVDEYLRLSYHGLRAKDKQFNAAMKTDYDPTTGTVNCIPQDMGRVLLNLYNNAFYAVSQKKAEGLPGYEPTVSIKTRKTNGKVEISVRDNGNGIPQKVREKIFQPFFTTKPTGQGTGLGLSLSYDIIKAHGGNITVNTKEGEYTEFTIQVNG